MLWVLLAAVLVLYVVNRAVLLTIFTLSIVLWVVVVGLIFYAVLWIVLTLDTLRLVRLVKVAPSARGFVGGLAVVALAVTAGGGAGYAAANAVSAIGVLDTVFWAGDRGAGRGALQHPAARWRRRTRSDGDAARQHLGRQHRCRDRFGRDLRHPAEHGAGAVRRRLAVVRPVSRTATTAATSAW